MTPRRLLLWVGLVAMGLTMVACSEGRGALVEGASGETEADYFYVIPAGTGERITAGEDVQIIPSQLDVEVGEIIRIVNEDDEGHFVGIFYVGAGETVTQRFSSPGEFSGACTIHPSGEITLTVTE